MGRHIYDHKGNWVWKYAFGGQASEQCRVFEHLGIGKYRSTDSYVRERYHDKLSLSRKDLERLKVWLKPRRKRLADFYRDYRNVFKKGTMGRSATFDDVRAMEARWPDIYFPAMCNRFVRDGKRFFKKNPRSRQWHLYGEM
jgi:hypothetical protein